MSSMTTSLCERPGSRATPRPPGLPHAIPEACAGDGRVIAHTLGVVEPVRRIEHGYRVRFDEAGADGCLRPSSLLRYAQDMAWRHSEEAGFDRGWYERRSMHWLVRNVKVSIRGSITYGDELAVSTEVIGWRHVWARRHSEIRRTGSSAGASANELMATVDDRLGAADDGRKAGPRARRDRRTTSLPQRRSRATASCCPNRGARCRPSRRGCGRSMSIPCGT